jgi:sugar phosphate isomerase/epimerase
MRLGVSAIGWDAEDHTEIVLHLPDEVELLEAVPFKRHSQFSGYLQKYSAQSLFYGMDIEAFWDQQSLHDCLEALIKQAKAFGWRRMVLGSPGLRQGDHRYLMDGLAAVHSQLEEAECTVCIEPVARQYGGDYFFTVEEIVQSLAEYSLPRIQTMIDTNSIWLESQLPEEVLMQYFPYIAHVHVSDEKIGPIVEQIKHERFADALRGMRYSGAVIREMLKAKNHPNEYHYFAHLYRPDSTSRAFASIK